MKSLGKQNVFIHTYINNVFAYMNMEYKTVYEKADGTYWINEGNTKIEVVLAKDNSNRRRQIPSSFKRNIYTFNERGRQNEVSW